MAQIPPHSAATPVSKVWNVPNILTYGRIVIIPLVAGLLMWPGERGDDTARWIALFLPAMVR